LFDVASVLAKTHRDALMLQLHAEFPMYDWAQNKAYPTLKHRNAIRLNGVTPYHRMSYDLLGVKEKPVRKKKVKKADVYPTLNLSEE
jgi:ribonuclease HII